MLSSFLQWITTVIAYPHESRYVASYRYVLHHGAIMWVRESMQLCAAAVHWKT